MLRVEDYLGVSPKCKIFNEIVWCFRPKKLVRITRDDYFNSEDHHLSTIPTRAEKACAYDLDDTDIAWLDIFNGERAQVWQLYICKINAFLNYVENVYSHI